jgi:uncharacterized protein (DUF433 family)
VEASWARWRRYAHLVAFERITVDPDVMGGMPTIRGLRIPVATVVAMVADGMSVAEIIIELPDLTPDDVAEALRYAAEAMRERELPLRHSA